MLALSPTAATLHAQLLEDALAFETHLTQTPVKGSVQEKTVKGQTYLYWQFKDPSGAVHQSYLGPASGAGAALARQLTEEKRDNAVILRDLQQKTAAFLAVGGTPNLRTHFTVVQALAQEGLFHQGAVLVGTHAFVCLGNLLGVSWTGKGGMTQDIDVARPRGVAVGMGRGLTLDVPDTLRNLGMGFFSVPGLDPRAASTSFQTTRGGVRVDFLTTQGTRGSTAPVPFKDMNAAAQPLRFMDYLLGGTPQRGVFIGPYALPVTLPEPGRFAVHKLVVSQLRGATQATKAGKDLAQAAQLAQALRDTLPGSLTLALEAATRTPGMSKPLRAALGMMEKSDPTTAAWLRPLTTQAAKK